MTSPAPRPHQLRCPFCRYQFEWWDPPELVATCPNPNLLPGDTTEQRAAGGRRCGALLAGHLVEGRAVYPKPEVVS